MIQIFGLKNLFKFKLKNQYLIDKLQYNFGKRRIVKNLKYFFNFCCKILNL